MKKETLTNIRIDKITTKEVLEKIKGFLLSDNQHYLITLNPEMVLEAQNNNHFKNIINQSDIVFADGTGILWALDFLKRTKESSFLGLWKKSQLEFLWKLLSIISILYNFVYTVINLLFNAKYRNNILQYKIPGIDLIYEICRLDIIENQRIFLLGAEEGVARKAALQLKEAFPNINIVGAEEGIIRNQKSDINNQELFRHINKTKPNILLVAFGAPKQEIWISENLKTIPSVKLAIGVGGSFDFISGKIKRAPQFLRKLELEWVWRLILEPKRIIRIYNATVKFSFLILKKALSKLQD